MEQELQKEGCQRLAGAPVSWEEAWLWAGLAQTGAWGEGVEGG